jgi:hypothetical protein
VEKGLLILYQLLEGKYVSDMGEYIPKSSFYNMYKGFWGNENNYNEDLDTILTELLSDMCSNIRLRIISAQQNNPICFKHVTMFLDGYDHTQICMDCNGMG